MSNTKSTLPLFSQRLISLWDMMQYPAYYLVHLMSALDFIKESGVHHRRRLDQPQGWTDDERKKIQVAMGLIQFSLDDLNLKFTKPLYDQLKRDIEHLPID